MTTRRGWLEAAVAGGVAAVLAIIATTIWIGSRVREETVVAKPYEEGLRHDAERSARAGLGLRVVLADPAPEAGTGALAFELLDRHGRPVEGAAVSVEISRSETSRGGRSAPARAAGAGRWVADVAFPGPGRWDVRFDVVIGPDRVRLERRVEVHAACDLAGGPCTRPLAGGGEVTLEIGPQPIRTMQELAVRATLREPSRPELLALSTVRRVEVSVSFSMPGMAMGDNRVALAPGRLDALEGKAVLVRCPSGKRDWIAEVSVDQAGAAPRTARFHFTVAP